MAQPRHCRRGPTEIPAGAHPSRGRPSGNREPAKAFLSPRRSLGFAIIAGIMACESAVPFRATSPLATASSDQPDTRRRRRGREVFGN
jgi:hypothetical protein